MNPGFQAKLHSTTFAGVGVKWCEKLSTEKQIFSQIHGGFLDLYDKWRTNASMFTSKNVIGKLQLPENLSFLQFFWYISDPHQPPYKKLDNHRIWTVQPTPSHSELHQKVQVTWFAGTTDFQPLQPPDSILNCGGDFWNATFPGPWTAATKGETSDACRSLLAGNSHGSQELHPETKVV